MAGNKQALNTTALACGVTNHEEHEANACEEAAKVVLFYQWRAAETFLRGRFGASAQADKLPVAPKEGGSETGCKGP
jgi:hypothetical protein